MTEPRHLLRLTMTACAVTVICVGSALLSMIRVVRLDPAEVFKT